MTTEVAPSPIHDTRHSLENVASKSDEVKEWDLLLKYLPSSSSLAHVRDALLTQGFCVLPSILTAEECKLAVQLMWDFVEDTSSGSVNRNDPSTWYPSSQEEEVDPWPCTGSFANLHQSLGAGWLLGDLREQLADRVFEPLYETRELHSSKEGFTFHRPTAPDGLSNPTMTNKESVGYRYDQPNTCQGLHTIQSLVALEDQVTGADGCLGCFPKSFGTVHQAMTKETYQFPLLENDIARLHDEFHLSSKQIYLNKGDVLIWRSDLVHALFPPTRPTRRFRAVAYCSMQPASLTSKKMIRTKMDAYKQRQTGDHRPNEENWHSYQQQNPFHRPFFRTSPPLVTIRQAELYGLLPYTSSEQERKQEMERALIRGVRFSPERLPVRPPTRRCDAHLEHLTADDETCMMGQDKYLGGMASPCGRYIYGVPGGVSCIIH